MVSKAQVIEILFPFVQFSLAKLNAAKKEVGGSIFMLDIV